MSVSTYLKMLTFPYHIYRYLLENYTFVIQLIIEPRFLYNPTLNIIIVVHVLCHRH